MLIHIDIYCIYILSELHIGTFGTDQDCRVLHGDAGGRGPQGSAQAMIILETDPCLGYKDQQNHQRTGTLHKNEGSDSESV